MRNGYQRYNQQSASRHERSQDQNQQDEFFAMPPHERRGRTDQPAGSRTDRGRLDAKHVPGRQQAGNDTGKHGDEDFCNEHVYYDSNRLRFLASNSSCVNTPLFNSPCSFSSSSTAAGCAGLVDAFV